jgi:sugar phosphate isomerase/epimerase
MDCLFSVSTAPIAPLGDKKYYDLIGTIQVLKRVQSYSVVDGFELQLEPEWDDENPPLTDTDFADWNRTPKYSKKEIVALLKDGALSILSVHASRDIGSYLCSRDQRHVDKGKRVIHDTLTITRELGSDVCVFHLWDTQATDFSPDLIQATFQDVAKNFPEIKAAVENVPTHLNGLTPFSLCKRFSYVTLDLRWATLYHELNAFKSIIKHIVNIHLHAKLHNDKWLLDLSDLDFYEVLKKVRTEWEYKGLLTVEPRGIVNSSNFDSFIEAMKTLSNACI